MCDVNVKNMPTWELNNVVTALSTLTFFNTQEETKRLNACKLELRRRNKKSKTLEQRKNHKKKV